MSLASSAAALMVLRNDWVRGEPTVANAAKRGNCLKVPGQVELRGLVRGGKVDWSLARRLQPSHSLWYPVGHR